MKMTIHSSWLEKLLFYFDLWGFATQFNKCANQSIINFLIFSLHILLALTSSYVIIEFLLRPMDDIIGTINDTMKFVTLLLAYWFSIFELHFNRREQSNLWQLMGHIDQQFYSHRHFFLAKYNIKIIAYFSITTLIYLDFLQHMLFKYQTEFLGFWFTHVLVAIALQNRSFLYLFYLELIKYELKIIVREVSEMKNVNKKNANLVMRKLHRSRFKWTRQYYESVHELCRLVHCALGWSNVTVILFPFYVILLDIAWLYWKVINGYPFRLMGER